MPEGQSVHRDFGTGQLHGNIRLQFLELFHAFGFQFDKHRAVEERFFVLAEVGEQLDDILQIALRFNAFADVGAAAFQSVAACGVLNDFTLFH